MSVVVVTGAGGFVGRAVVAALAEAGFAVRAILRDGGSLPQFGPDVDVRILPPIEVAAGPLAEACAGADMIVHLADNPVRTASGESSSAALARALDDACRAAGVQRVVFASSIYASRDAQAKPNSYGAGKRAAEQVFFAGAGYATVALRLPPVYGQGAKGGIAMLAALVRRGLPLPFGRARAQRDYLSVDNLAALVVALANCEKAAFARLSGRWFEPSDGAPVATCDLVAAVGTAMGRKPWLIPVPPPLLTLPAALVGRKAQVEAVFAPLRCADDEELKAVTGWQPQRSLAINLRYLEP